MLQRIVETLFGSALWQMVQQTDFLSMAVLLILLLLSIVCWALFLYKLILLQLKRGQMGRAITRIRAAHTLDDVLKIVGHIKGTVPGYFISQNLAFLKSIMATNPTAKLTDVQSALVQQHLDQTIDELAYKEESYLPFISTSAHVSPLLGLLGTVWGLIQAFVSISQKQTADISAIAPGIAQALTTTLAGLLVAIPALVMFNYLTTQVRRLEQQLVLLSDAFNLVVQRLRIQ